MIDIVESENYKLTKVISQIMKMVEKLNLTLTIRFNYKYVGMRGLIFDIVDDVTGLSNSRFISYYEINKDIAGYQLVPFLFQCQLDEFMRNKNKADEERSKNKNEYFGTY